MKAKHPEAFQDPALFHRALRVLANYHYRLLTRRYVMELFGDVGLDANRVRAICEAGEATRLPRSETNHTITQDDQIRHPQSTNNGDEFKDKYEDEAEAEEEIEMSLSGLPVRSGTGLLEAYDKTDYFSDDSGDGDGGAYGKKLMGSGKVKEAVRQLEPIITIRGFLLS